MLMNPTTALISISPFSSSLHSCHVFQSPISQVCYLIHSLIQYVHIFFYFWRKHPFPADLPFFTASLLCLSFTHSLLLYTFCVWCQFPCGYTPRPLEPGGDDEMLKSSSSQWEGKLSHTIDPHRRHYCSILSRFFYLSSCRSFSSCNLQTLTPVQPAPVHWVITSVCHGHKSVRKVEDYVFLHLWVQAGSHQFTKACVGEETEGKQGGDQKTQEEASEQG